MQKYLQNKLTIKLFYALTKNLRPDELSKFMGLVRDAYMEKQVSEDSLQTYKITSEELEAIFGQFTSSNKNNFMQTNYVANRK